MVNRLGDLDMFRSLSEPLLMRPSVVCAYCNRRLSPGAPGGLASCDCCEACQAPLLGEGA